MTYLIMGQDLASTRQTRRHLPSTFARTRQTRRHSPSHVAKTRQTRRHSPKAIFEKNVTRLDTFARVIPHFHKFGASGPCLLFPHYFSLGKNFPALRINLKNVKLSSERKKRITQPPTYCHYCKQKK